MGLDRAAAHAALEELERAAVNGRVPGTVTSQMAASLACSARTVRRLRQRGIPGGRRKRFECSERDIQAFYDVGGRSTVAYMVRAREERSAGRPFISRVTFERALKRALPPHERAFARGGAAAERQKLIHARWEVRHRNQVWHFDSHLCRVQVLVPGYSSPVRPWLIGGEDAASRAIVGWDLVPATGIDVEDVRRKGVDTDDVLRVLQHAIADEPWAGPFGGAPDVLVFDNARAHLAHATTDALSLLGIYSAPIDPFAAHQNGKVERLFGTLEASLLPAGPRHGDAPRNAAGERYQTSEVQTLAAFKAELAGVIDDYNRRRPHRSLAGRTPLERWRDDDDRPLRTFTSQALAFTLRNRTARKVRNDGVHHGGRRFYADALQNLVGERVEIATAGGDGRAIYVWSGGDFVCTAIELDPYDHDQAIAVAEGRKAARGSSRQRMRQSIARKTTRVREANAAAPEHAATARDRDGAPARRAMPSQPTLDALRGTPTKPEDGR